MNIEFFELNEMLKNPNMCEFHISELKFLHVPLHLNSGFDEIVEICSFGVIWQWFDETSVWINLLKSLAICQPVISPS